MTTVWVAKSAGIILSDADHHALSNAAGAQGAIAGSVKTFAGGGKHYLEFDGSYGADTCVIALGDARYTTPGVGPPVAETYLLVTNNGFTACWNNTGTAASFATGRIDLAINLDSSPVRFFHRLNGGAWEFSGDPVANTGGKTPTSAIDTHIKPVIYFGASTRFCTLNCGDRPFAGSVPAGYSAWDAGDPVPRAPLIIMMQ